MLSSIESKIPDFLGKLYGGQVVGVFSLAAEISRYPSTEIVVPINRAVYPGLFELKGDLGELKSNYLQLPEFICLVVFPIGLALSIAAKPIVALLLGSNWGVAVEPIRILSVASGCVFFKRMGS